MDDIIKPYIEKFPQDKYLHYHARRYSTLLRLIKEKYKTGDRVLDIGRSRFTQMLSDFLKMPVDTIGFQAESDSASGKHYNFNLNDCQEAKKWRRDIAPYDIIIFAEVIEHLFTSPNFVLGFINSITSPGGCLFLQTPNAVALHKRLIMLFGKNPYEKIRENNKNPGHFREYTRNEIDQYAIRSGFRVKKFIYGNYFDYRFSPDASNGILSQQFRRLLNRVYALSPGGFQPGMTFMLVKEGEYVQA